MVVVTYSQWKRKVSVSLGPLPLRHRQYFLERRLRSSVADIPSLLFSDPSARKTRQHESHRTSPHCNTLAARRRTRRTQTRDAPLSIAAETRAPTRYIPISRKKIETHWFDCDSVLAFGCSAMDGTCVGTWGLVCFDADSGSCHNFALLFRATLSRKQRAARRAAPPPESGHFPTPSKCCLLAN